jgi:8-oxo-dGTP diphosphatase
MHMARGAVAIITNSSGQVLLHLRDDLDHIAWPGYWSVLGGGADGDETPVKAIVRELQEEAGLTAEGLSELFDVHDADGSGQMITFFAGTWDGDEKQLPLAEGVELRFFDPEDLEGLKIPPYINDGIRRWQATQAGGA